VAGSVADESWSQADDYSYADSRDNYEEDISGAGHGHMPRRPTDVLRTLADYNTGPLELHDEGEGEYWEDEDEDDENRFVNYSLLSHIAVQLRDKIPRGTHVKGSIPYPRAFTGKDIVVCSNLFPFRELELTGFSVDNSNPDTTRTSNQSWSIHQRQARSIASCSKPAKSTLLLRSRMGWSCSPGWR
jgi:hypothetical protein